MKRPSEQAIMGANKLAREYCLFESSSPPQLLNGFIVEMMAMLLEINIKLDDLTRVITSAGPKSDET